MKKKLSLVLALALTLALAACGGQTDPPGNTPPEVSAPDAAPASSTAVPGPSENTGTPDTTPAASGEGGILIAYFGVPETDGTDTVANASRVASEDGVVGNCQFIAQAIQQAVGGGSVIDCCKVVAAQAVLEEDIWDMELVQHRLPTVTPIPMGAVVTASGTGAEMNGGAVITHEEKKVKTGIFAAAPRFAVLDPDYTMSVPFLQEISGAFDTLSHAMETYFGRADRDNVSDDLAEAVMRNTIRNMRVLLQNPNDYTARSNLMWDSAMAENGILKCGRVTDFQAHQIEHQLGAYTDCNHGQGLAVLHPPLYRVMCRKAPEKFARFAVNVWGISGEGKPERELAMAGVEALADFIRECGLPTRLGELVMEMDSGRLLTSGTLKEIADSCNLIQTGQVQLSHMEIFEILKSCV